MHEVRGSGARPAAPGRAGCAAEVGRGRRPATPELPVSEARQIANFADFCNDCGNCDVFCSDDGGPYVQKPRLFVSRERWRRDAPRDPILVERDGITARFDGVVVRVVYAGARA